jgi:hypothetical protein
MFLNGIDPGGFNDMWNGVAILMGNGRTYATLSEFVTLFAIPYNETGGAFRAFREAVGQNYVKGSTQITPTGLTGTLKPQPCYDQDIYLFHKYNLSPGAWAQHRPAGELLINSGPNRPDPLITEADKAAWNSNRYPIKAPDAVKQAARECDFFKYSGLGLQQLTWRGSYIACADPVLRAYNTATGEGVEDMCNADLEKAFTDPNVYLACVCALNNQSWNLPAFLRASKGQTVDDFVPYGHLIAEGQGNPSVYGPNCYGPRCVALRTAMAQVGYTMGDPPTSSGPASQ